MSAIDTVLPRLKVEEGFRSALYRDTRGFQTIGYGFNVDAGLTEYAASGLLQAQVEELHRALLVYQWYGVLDPVRQSACLDIAFNTGLHGFVNGFPHLIGALSRSDWITAESECAVSNPELKARYDELGKIFLTGVA